MSRSSAQSTEALQLWTELDAYLEAHPGELVRPGHRIKFVWPPPPISYEFRIAPGRFTQKEIFKNQGEKFAAKIADTEFGIFGRCEELWLEARGETVEDVLDQLSESANPLLCRQRAIAKTLEMDKRYTGRIKDLPPIQLLKLLFCEDRDVAHTAHTDIELQAGQHGYGLSLVNILKDRRHAMQRTAQWNVLDLLEDVSAFFTSDDEMHQVVDAIVELMWDAPDDYIRCIFKAGVVLGGHMSSKYSLPALTKCLEAPSAFGRRSAVHGLFHVVEWDATTRSTVIATLAEYAEQEPEKALKEFAVGIAEDLKHGVIDHLPEPIFSGE